MKTLYQYITEKHGVMDGLPEMCVYVASDIIKRCAQTKGLTSFRYTPAMISYNVNSINNMDLFFRMLVIEIDDYIMGEGVYLTDCSKLYNKKFDRVYILIASKTLKNKNVLVNTLLHEITHAWNDYNARLVNKDITTIIDMDKYVKIMDLKDTDSKAVKKCKMLMYVTNKMEQHAFQGEILGKVKQLVSSGMSYDEILDELDEIEMYKNIVICYNLVLKMEEGKLKEDIIKEIVDTFNDINGSHLSTKKVIDKLAHSFKSFIDKINDDVAKIFTDKNNEKIDAEFRKKERELDRERKLKMMRKKFNEGLAPYGFGKEIIDIIKDEIGDDYISLKDILKKEY